MASSCSCSNARDSMMMRPAAVASSKSSFTGTGARASISSPTSVVAPHRRQRSAVIPAAATTERSAPLPPASAGTGSSNRRVMIIGERT